jgi:hypothetical protein
MTIDKAKYGKECRALVAEMDPIVKKYIVANTGAGGDDLLAVNIALGALTMEMVHVIYKSYAENDRQTILESWSAQMKTGLKATDTVEKLKALAK